MANNSSQGESTEDKVFLIVSRYAVPIVFGIITLLGIAGNTLVIHVIATRSKMRTVTNLLLLNLAVSDLAFVIICPLPTAYSFAYQTWPFGSFLCKLMHYTINSCAYVTVYTLVVISAFRFFTVVYNSQTVHLRTHRNAVIMIAFLWVVFLSANYPITQAYDVVVRNSSGVSLDCDMKSEEFQAPVFYSFFVFGYLLPLCLIGLLSVGIIAHLNKQRPTTISQSTPSGIRSNSRKKSASRLIILVVVLFAILWLPIQLHLVIAVTTGKQMPKSYLTVAFLWNLMAYANSCINPFIYNQASKDFRYSFKEVVSCLKCCPRNQNSRTPSLPAGQIAIVPAGADQKERRHLIASSGPHKEECQASSNV
ncbi:unnamed protein product [Dimorphilus gyrociliatus]|uniref:G-protein coupled receptors family 1 profile domain-containing protein n=1 Tax=Dimorphilus gyrociliatus TaxID=2664684 RepID=A0A7I8W0D5_9ANNE|nr:unnamed protein product [Dimorphilus gyrociliatus]